MANVKQHPLRLPENRDELIARAIAAEDTHVSVGGLAVSLGTLREARRTGGARRVAAVSPRPQGLQAVGRLVQLTRRRLGLSPEEFAAQNDLDLREVVELEAAQVTPEPRVLYQLSRTLKVSYEKLLTLVGHRERRDQALEREALLFAAHSGPMDRLSKSESQALQDFVRARSE